MTDILQGPGLTAAGKRRPRLSLPTLSLVLFLTFLDNTVVSVTLAAVQSSLHTGVSGLQWVVSAYALVFASFMLAFGALSDRIGRKEVMLAGVAVFCAGSVLGALAPNITVLWSARAIMGLGAAASEPGTLSMIRQLYSDRRERARALGIWSAVSALALAAGPVIGGALVGVWSWRAVFWFNLFFGLVALVVAAFVLPENADPQRGGHFDYLGFVLGAGALGCATFAVISGETLGYSSTEVKILFAVAVVALVAFVVVELKVANPVLDVRFFKLPAFAGSTFVAFSTYFSVFSVFFFVALYLEVVGSQSGYQIALDFLPMAAAMVIASAISGRWVAWLGPRIPMFAGSALAATGVILIAVYLKPTSGLSTLGWILPIAGFGFGTAIVPVAACSLSVVPAQHSGMAASATNTARELGAVAGVAILGSVVNGQLTVGLSRRLAAIGIPPAFRDSVITAVTTGAISTQAHSAEKNKAIAAIVERVTNAAYGAFTSGLHLSLVVAAVLMIVSAIVALVTVRRLPATHLTEFGLREEPAAGRGDAVDGGEAA